MGRMPHLGAGAALILAICLGAAHPAHSGLAGTVAPDLQTSAPRKQPLDKIRVKVRCANEPCTVVADGVVRSKHPDGRDGPAISLRPQETTLAAGERQKLRLNMGQHDERYYRRLLERGGRVKAKLKAAATDEDGNRSVDRRRVKLTD